MKIIDLLNKIANDEEVPKHIHIRDVDKYTWQDDVKAYLSDVDANDLFNDLDLSLTNLNEEVEIIEEDNKINYVGKEYDLTKLRFDYPETAYLLKDLCNKTKEIIDKLNEMENK